MVDGVQLIGGVQVSIDLKIGHDEIAKWRPETIRAFFAGLSLVLSARDAGSQQARLDIGLAALGAGNDAVASVVSELKDSKERSV